MLRSCKDARAAATGRNPLAFTRIFPGKAPRDVALMESAMFVQIRTDNQILSDAEANERLEQRVREKLGRFEQRLSHVEVHVADVNAHKGGDADKRVSLEARPTGHQPVAVTADAARIDDAVTGAASKAARRLDSLFGKLADRR